MFVTNFYQFPPAISNMIPPAISNMVAWYRGDSLVLSGSNVIGWNDKSVNARHMTAFNTPTATENGLGTRTVANFSKNTGTNATYCRWNGDAAVAHGFSIVGIFRATVADVPNAVAGSSAVYFGKGSYWENEGNYICGNASGWEEWIGSTNITNTWVCSQIDFNTDTSQGFLNNVLDGSMSMSGELGIGESGLDQLLIGTTTVENSIGDARSALAGSVAEVIFYNRILTSGERTELDTYVAEYYGI